MLHNEDTIPYPPPDCSSHVPAEQAQQKDTMARRVVTHLQPVFERENDVENCKKR